MNLVKYGLTDSHSDTIYCLANSVEELDQEFDLFEYRITKLVYQEHYGIGHVLTEKEILNTAI